jgi:hypothetical protein
MRTSLLSLDLTSVLLFVAMGRATHETGTSLSGYLEVAAPFVIGLVVGWIATRAWREPLSIETGIGVLASTVVVGMLLRKVAWNDGIQLSFVLVATAFLALFLIGWRLVAERVSSPSGGRRVG